MVFLSCFFFHGCKKNCWCQPVCFILFILDETQTMRYGNIQRFPAQLQLSLPGEILQLSKTLTVNVRVQCQSLKIKEQGFLSTLTTLHLQQSHWEKTIGKEAESRDATEILNLLFLTVSIAIIIDLSTYESNSVSSLRDVKIQLYLMKTQMKIARENMQQKDPLIHLCADHQ